MTWTSTSSGAGLAPGSSVRELAICSGIGGLSLGLKRAFGGNHRTLCHIEREGFAAATLVARMEDKALDSAPIWDEVETFDCQGFLRDIGQPDIITAGFPCQPASKAGRRTGGAHPGWLWPSIARIIRATRPAAVFLENVPCLLRHGFPRVLLDLHGLGMDVRWCVLSAQELLAPHRRERLFILAHTDSGRHQVQNAIRPGRAVIGDSPWRKPIAALCRVADGVPRGLDERNRALGNAVIPRVAAAAIVALASDWRISP